MTYFDDGYKPELSYHRQVFFEQTFERKGEGENEVSSRYKRRDQGELEQKKKDGDGYKRELSYHPPTIIRTNICGWGGGRKE